MTKNEILSVLKFYRFHNKFFPMPIFLDIGKKQKEDIKNQMEQNRIQAILTLDMDNIPANFQEILKHEQEVVAKWKAHL